MSQACIKVGCNISFVTAIEGSSVKMHICGDISHLLPSLKKLKLDILDIDWQVNFNNARQWMNPEVAICGNLNPVIVQDSTVDQITGLTSTLVDSQRGKKFILSAGCEISVNTPHQNLMAMRKVF